jgi:hypothetical protein
MKKAQNYKPRKFSKLTIIGHETWGEEIQCMDPRLGKPGKFSTCDDCEFHLCLPKPKSNTSFNLTLNWLMYSS